MKRVDWWNSGMCLDTFNIVGGAWEDPASRDGNNGPKSDEKLHASLSALVKNVDVKKFWFVQVDGGKLLSRSLA